MFLGIRNIINAKEIKYGMLSFRVASHAKGFVKKEPTALLQSF